MPRTAPNRKLAAILVADIVGYSSQMGEDEAGTLRELKYLDDQVVKSVVSASRGTIIKKMGDGYLVEFSTASEAIDCAAKWQSEVKRINTEKDGYALQFRIGINVGEIVSDGQDIFGDGVNIAARLEALATPGSVCVSEMVKRAVDSRPEFQFEDIGVHELKNIKTPVQAYLVSFGGEGDGIEPHKFSLSDQSEIRYCVSRDGTSIAHANVGEGYPLLFAGSWMTHLEWDWNAPSTQDYISHLAPHFSVIRYDQRGNGMSDWDDVEIEFERMVDDMECVIEQYDYEEVAILGMSQGASVAIAYAIRHPERVSHLVLNGGYPRGRRRRGKENEHEESVALVNLIRHGWAAENPAFRQTMTSLYMPDATAEEAAWFNEFQKACGPGENMARFREMFDDLDITDMLQEVAVPALIVHSDEDSVAPLSEGKVLASRISGARFVKLKSKNHTMFGNEPDFPKLIASIVDFIQ